MLVMTKLQVGVGGLNFCIAGLD